MSSANVRVAAPKHAGDDHPLVYPDAQSQEASAETDSSKSGSNAASASAAFSRALAGMLAFMFKRPIRLFRPVKISTMAGIQAIAEEQGRSVTPAFVRGLIRKEGWRFFPKHVLPPLTINALIGLTLFTTYTTTESLLHARFDSPAATYLMIPFVSGAFAGAAQTLISAPLDNARHLLLRRQRFLRQAAEIPRASRRQRLRTATGGSAGLPFTSWWTLLRDSVFSVGSSKPATLSSELPAAIAKLSGRERLERARRWARRGWSFFTLSVTKDGAAFGAFFLVFECGREASRRFGLAYDGISLPSLSTFDDREGESPVHDKQRRSASGLILQSLGILISGGIAGWVFSLVARPFERVRAAIYEGRAKWAEQQSRPNGTSRRGGADTGDGRRQKKQRARSAGGASERKSWAELGAGGRKSFTVRIGHLRRVSLRSATSRARKGDTSTRDSKPGSELLTARPVPAASTTSLSRGDNNSQTTAPGATMPGALVLVRQACHQYGTTRFLFGPRSALQALDAQRQRASILPSATGKPMSSPPKRPTPGPTRLSARGKQAAASAQTSASTRLLRVGTTVLRYVPPYAIGFFAYAIVSGDLKIEHLKTHIEAHSEVERWKRSMQDVNLGATDFAPLDPPPFSSLAVQREKLPATMSERVRYARKARARVSYAPASESSDDSDADDHEKRKAGSAGRRAGQPRKGPAVIDSDGDEASDESETPKKPRKKRPKKSTLSKKNTKQSAKKKKGGQLEGVKILPLELLGEICSHLAPVDLLSLQLVNKHFYRLITAKAFQSVWVTSRRCLGLPDVGGMTEAQYATFVFGKACQSCGVKKLSLVRHDYHLRRILCKACRHQRIVKVSRLQKDQPDLLAKLHPLTLQAVTRTAYDTRSTTKSRWLDGDEQEYVDIQDLYYTDAILRDLDDQDLDSDIAAGRDEDCDTSTPTNDRTPGSRVARKSGTRVDKLSGPTRRSRRAKKLIQLREKERASLLQNSHRLFQAHGMVDKALNWSGWYRKSEHCILRPVKAQKRPPAYRGARYRKIEARLAEEDASFKKLVYIPGISKFCRRDGPLTDAQWEQMKPTVLKVARRALEEYAKRASWPAQREQQRRLRKRYDTFLATLDDRARPFIPLFLDFLLLPSIQALWQPGKEISDAAWEAAQPSLQEDLNDYRLETCLRVRRLIISVTQGDDGGQDEHEDEEDEVATITDKFFLRADSFVCCGFAGCPGKSRPTSYWRNGLWHQPDDPRQDWIGALPDVLAHQHKFHNSDTSLPVKGFRGADSQLQIALPLEVACGMSAILELHGLDGKPAEKRHLERGSAQTHGFEWRNSKMSRHSFNGKTAWRDLLGLIKLEGDKLRKLDLYLEPPVIEYATRRDKKLVFPVTDDEMANGDEVSLGPQHEQPDQEEA